MTPEDRSNHSGNRPRYFEGLSVAELGRRQGIPASTGRTRLARALVRLRESLLVSSAIVEAGATLATSSPRTFIAAPAQEGEEASAEEQS